MVVAGAGLIYLYKLDNMPYDWLFETCVAVVADGILLLTADKLSRPTELNAELVSVVLVKVWEEKVI